MIDTDKYEGHTRGPWFASEEEMEEGKAWVMWGGEHWVVMDKSDGHLWIEWMKEDAILAADAPLLLAEVKRLRNIILKFDDAIYHGNFDINQLLGIWHNLLTKEEEE